MHSAIVGERPIFFNSRAQEILRMGLHDANNKDIERKLFISASMVRNHLDNIYQKLSVKNRLELINLIGRVGLPIQG